jgi:hypothetical protein
MDALLAYASDGTASNEPGEDDAESVEHQAEQQQVSGGATPAATEVEFTAEERLLAADGSEGGIYIHSSQAAHRSRSSRSIANSWQQQSSRKAGGRTAASSITSRAIRLGVWATAMKTAQVVHRPQDTLCWEDATFTDCVDTQFSHGDLVELLFLMFETVTKVFICQE